MPPIGNEPTNPEARAYWVAKLESEMENLRVEVRSEMAEARSQVSVMGTQLNEVIKMKWWPVKVLAGSTLVVVFALAGFAVFFINRMDNEADAGSTARAQVENRLGLVDTQLRVDFQNHQTQEENRADRIERKVDKLVDVIVEGERPSRVRAKP